MSEKTNEHSGNSTTFSYILTEEQMAEQHRRAREDYERYQRTSIRNYLISIENDISTIEENISSQKEFFNDMINDVKQCFATLDEYITHVEDPEIVIIPELQTRIDEAKNKLETLITEQESLSVYVANADEIVRQKCFAREMAIGYELSLKDKIAEAEAELAKKDVELAEKDSALAEKDAALAEKDAALAEKDAALAEKDAELTRLRKLAGEE